MCTWIPYGWAGTIPHFSGKYLRLEVAMGVFQHWKVLKKRNFLQQWWRTHSKRLPFPSRHLYSFHCHTNPLHFFLVFFSLWYRLYTVQISVVLDCSERVVLISPSVKGCLLLLRCFPWEEEILRGTTLAGGTPPPLLLRRLMTHPHLHRYHFTPSCRKLHRMILGE